MSDLTPMVEQMRAHWVATLVFGKQDAPLDRLDLKPDPTGDYVIGRHLAPDLYVAVQPLLHGQGRIVMMKTPTSRLYDHHWMYSTVVQALAALTYWEYPEQEEPNDWIRTDYRV